MATVDTLNLSINGNSKQATTALNNLIKSLKKFETEVTPDRLGAVANGFKSINRSLSSISNSNINKVEKLANALEKISKSKVGSVSNSVKGASTNATKISSTVKSATQATNVPSVSDATATAQEVTTALSGNTVSKVEETTDKISTMAKIAGVANKAVAIVGASLKVFGKVLGTILKPITHFIRSLARVAFYRFIRGIIKGITDGLKEGIKNLALYSKALDGLDTHNANDVMSRYSSAFLYFKNAIATAVIPVLRALIPIVEQAMMRIVDFINILAQFGSAFFGTTFTKAKYFWVDYADSIDNATGSAKELNHQLANFDELNNLNDNRNNGGGGNSALQNAKDMFEEAEISSKIQSLVEKLKNVWETVKDIFEPVKKIFEKVKELFELAWDKVSPNLTRIWNSLKKIWNDVLKPLIKGFVEGFVDGFLMGDEFDSLPDVLGFISDKLADCAENVADFLSKIDNKKIEDFGKFLGVVCGWIVGLIPVTMTMGVEFVNWKDRVQRLSDYIKTNFKSELDDLKGKIENVKDKVQLSIDKFKTLCDRIFDLHDPTSLLSTYIKDLSDKFITVKNKAHEFYDRLVNLVTEITDVKKKAEALKSYWDNHNIFENVLATAAVFLYEITQIKTLLDGIKKLGEIVIKITLNLTNGGVLDTLLDGLSKIGSDVADKVSQIEKETTNPQAQLPTTPSTKTSNNNNKTVSPTNLKNTRNSNDNSTLIKKRKALGGYLDTGDIFIANERGAEMIGSIGGNTAVANNNQITEAIAQATYTAMTKALAENGGSVNIVVEGDGDKMFNVFQKKQREFARTTGLAY